MNPDEFLKGEDFEVIPADQFIGGEDFTVEGGMESPSVAGITEKPGFFSKQGALSQAGEKIASPFFNFFFPEKFQKSIQGSAFQSPQEYRQDILEGKRPSNLETAGAAAKGGLSFLSLLGGGAASTAKLAAQSGALGAGFGAAQALESGKGFKGTLAPAAVTGLLSAAVPPVLKGVSNFITRRGLKALGMVTGEHPSVIEAALKNPAAADAGAVGGDAALREVVNEGSKHSVQLRNDFIQAHADAFKQLTKGFEKRLVGKKEIISGFENLLRGEGVKITKEGLDFTTSKIIANPGEISKIQNAYTAIKAWDDFSLKGLNNLKQLIGTLTKFANEVGKSSKSPTLGRTYNLLNETISKNLPAGKRKIYEAMNKKFANNIGLFDDMVKAFNSKDPFKKLAGVLGENEDTLRGIVRLYEQKTGKGVIATVAGRKIGMEREAAFGFLNPRDWIDLLLPPEKQAKLVLKTGQKLVAPTAKRGISVLGRFLRLGGQRALSNISTQE